MITVHGGSALDSATIEAWKTAYALIAEVMIAASNDYRGLRTPP
jgi:nitric oxide dioxygenase